MEKDGTKWAGDHTLLTGNAFFFINVTVSIFHDDSIGWTILLAFWFFTLSAHNRHPDNRVWINNHHPDAALFGVIGSKSIDRTYYLTKPTARAPLRNNCQSPGHNTSPFLLIPY